MKRKLLFILLLNILLIGLSSCALNVLIIRSKTNTIVTTTTTTASGSDTAYHTNITPGTQASKEISPTYKEGDYELIQEKMDEAYDLMEAGSNFRKFEKLYDDINAFYYSIQEDAGKSYVLYSMYGKDEDMANYSTFYGYYLVVYEFLNNLHHDVMDSLFRYDFYGDMTDDEIYEMIGEQKDEKYYEYQKEMQDIQNEFLALSSREVYSKAPNLLFRYINTANKLAKLEGYNNYMEYAYENEYFRDYEVSDTINFYNYVVEYTWPKYKEYAETFSNNYSSRSKDARTIKGIFEENGFSNYMDEFDSYAEYMGGKYYDMYKHLWSGDGYYFISDDDNCYEGAYTDMFGVIGEPYVYFGKGYQGILTLVHEFGHYYAFTEYSGMTSYDLAETQSQANELLFMLHFLNNSNYSENVKDLITCYKLMDAFETIYIGTIVNEFERLCYYDEDLTEAEILEYAKEVLKPFGEEMDEYFSFDYYWRYVCVDSPVYYISYATSLISSLEIYFIGKEDLDKGKEAYLKVCINDFDNLGYKQILASANLFDPFSEDAFKLITK